jgi:hypothetical protein
VPSAFFNADAAGLSTPGGQRRSAEADGVLPQSEGRRRLEAGIEAALSAVLVNPEFLFRIEQIPPASRRTPLITSVTGAGLAALFFLEQHSG